MFIFEEEKIRAFLDQNKSVDVKCELFRPFVSLYHVDTKDEP